MRSAGSGHRKNFPNVSRGEIEWHGFDPHAGQDGHHESYVFF